MCTAVKYGKCFGRTLDFEHSFSEEPVHLPGGFETELRNGNKLTFTSSVIGTASIFGGAPLLFDGMNERGLCVAALNFPKYAVYRKGRAGFLSLASFEVASYILGSFSSVNEAKIGLRNLWVTDESFSDELAPTPMHWMVADEAECIVIEPLSDGVKIYENEVGVMTNAPSFEYQLTRLSDFMQLDSEPPTNRLKKELEMTPYSRGMGAIGLPGDWSSTSRFVRAAFVKEKLDSRNMSDFEALLEVLKSVSVPHGCVVTENGKSVGTLYTACMDMEAGAYRYSKQGDIKGKMLKFR